MPFEIDFEDPRIGFASAHFIVGHDKCGRLHGHNYFLKVNIKCKTIQNNMVIDYGILKEELRKITLQLDHKVIVPKKAKELLLKESNDSIEISSCNKRYLFPKEDVVLLPVVATTAEELAKYFHKELRKLWPTFSIKVTIEESPGAMATFTI